MTNLEAIYIGMYKEAYLAAMKEYYKDGTTPGEAANRAAIGLKLFINTTLPKLVDTSKSNKKSDDIPWVTEEQLELDL